MTLSGDAIKIGHCYRTTVNKRAAIAKVADIIEFQAVTTVTTGRKFSSKGTYNRKLVDWFWTFAVGPARWTQGPRKRLSDFAAAVSGEVTCPPERSAPGSSVVPPEEEPTPT
jgi:hypothetical protein